MLYICTIFRYTYYNIILSRRRSYAFSITQTCVCLFLFIIIEILSIKYCHFGLIIPILSICLDWFIIHFYLRESFYDYGLHWNHIPKQCIGAIFLAFCFDFLINPLFIGNFIVFIHTKSYLNIALHLSTLIYAISEEIVYRGFLLIFFQRLKIPSLFNILICSFLFGISHYPLHHSIHLVVSTFISGFVYGYLRLKEGETFSLFSLILAHTLYNTFCI